MDHRIDIKLSDRIYKALKVKAEQNGLKLNAYVKMSLYNQVKA